MNINSVNSASFGNLYVHRALGAILSEAQNELRCDVLFPNHKYYPENNSKKLFGIDIYNEKRENKDITQILAEKLDQQGKDVLVILKKRGIVNIQLRQKDKTNAEKKPLGEIISQQNIINQYEYEAHYAQNAFKKLCNFLIENINK